jgi:ABC-type cobalamin/Fe3+-siderophores transport system ATPase subunit
MNTLKEKPEIFSVIANGCMNRGKSTTIREVCRKLKPTKVCRLDIGKKVLCKDSVEDIKNGTYLIEVNEKNILVIAGAPTEQGKTVTQLFEYFVELGKPVVFILSAMRFYERLPGFDTVNQLKEISTLLDIVFITRIKRTDFKQASEWQERIDKIVKLITEHIKIETFARRRVDATPDGGLRPAKINSLINNLNPLKMKVIMLLGPGNSGKTKTMNRLYKKLKGENDENIICPRTQYGGEPCDFECILCYGGKKVALFSMGDMARGICCAISFYKDSGCDILVCTCNDKFSIPQRYVKDHYTGSIMIPKSIADRKDEEDMKAKNEKDVNEIISNLQKIIEQS